MLIDLIIKNFAIIDQLHVSFGPGFNVLTGETGAGKSIVIDAVNLLLGGRARADLIRTGEEEATVEALFDLSGVSKLREDLAAAGLAEGAELLVRRIVSRSGKNRVLINGSLATLGQLQGFVGRLVAIYGQHEHQSLQRAETHLPLLDRHAGLEEEGEAYRSLYEEAQTLADRLHRLAEAERQRQQRLDLLSFQTREIAAANLKPGEDKELTVERALLMNAERLFAGSKGGYESLYGEEGAVCEQLDKTAATLEGLAAVDPLLGQLAETVRNSQYALEDVAVQLRDYADQVTFEPGRQEEVERRLALMTELKRKYASTVEEILAYREKAERELADLTDLESTRDVLLKELAAVRERCRQAGESLSTRRREAGQKLALAVEKELADLAMDKARFEVRFFPLAEPGPRGLERGEFHLSSNPGEELRPLVRIASGGELSRIMLALKRTAPEGDEVGTLIFDEVDAGIGGATATAVGEKLQGVARERQVLCITHLPQVAAFADRHYRVEKGEQEGRTRTTLTHLEGEGRIFEMARMLGGARVTEQTLAHAREIIAHCRAGQHA